MRSMEEKKRELKKTRKGQFRRRIEGRTDYQRRLKLLKSRKPRLVVRRSLKYIRAQIVEFEEQGDKTVASATSSTLRGMGWQFSCDSTPAAYLTGLMIGRAAKDKKINEVVLDIGLYASTKGSKVYAVTKGAADAGLTVPCDAEMFPSEGRISGKHIAAYNEKFKDMPEQFEKIKQKILGEKISREKSPSEKISAKKSLAEKTEKKAKVETKKVATKIAKGEKVAKKER